MEQARTLLGQGDTAAGVERLHRLSAGGAAAASSRLAAFHALGVWVAKDWSEAHRFLNLAKTQGSDEAGAQLALLMAEGAPDRLPARELLCERPRVRQLRGFVTSATCDWLIERARGRLQPAATLETGRETYSQDRTNSAFAFGPWDSDCVLALVRERTALALGVPEAAIEPPQVFHYAVGQSFSPHVDYLPPTGRSQRIATVLVYLNAEFEAGETAFLRADLKANPGVGGALYFANVDASGAPDPLSLHAGLAPTRGEKWLLSQWVHDRPYTG